MSGATLDEALRPVLAGLAAAMIPAGAGLPSAGDVDLAGARIDEVLRARPDLTAPLNALLARVADEPAEVALSRVIGDQADHELLALVVVGGYMLSADVGRALRYPGQQPKPVNPFDINDVVDDGLLDAVVERGAIYRPTPGAEPR